MERLTNLAEHNKNKTDKNDSERLDAELPSLHIKVRSLEAKAERLTYIAEYHKNDAERLNAELLSHHAKVKMSENYADILNMNFVNTDVLDTTVPRPINAANFGSVEHRLRSELTQAKARIEDLEGENQRLDYEVGFIKDILDNVVTSAPEYEDALDARTEESLEHQATAVQLQETLNELHWQMVRKEEGHRQAIAKRELEIRGLRTKIVQDDAKWKAKVAELEKKIKALEEK